jgi:hypothetical protein
MNIDPAMQQIILAVIINVPIWYLMRANLRKTNTDAYEALATALQTSGKTIGELFEMLSELPELKDELEKVKRDWRADNQGAWANHDELVSHELQPPYVPRKRYATGPLAK